jgi:hypothetical protein
MGQYHTPINLTKREYLDAHTFGNGTKLMEFGQSGFTLMFALGYLLENDWKGDVITIAGDYGDPEDHAPELLKELGIDCGDSTLYSTARGDGNPEYFRVWENGEKTDKYDTVALETSKTFRDVSKRTIAQIESADLAIWGKEKPKDWGECFHKINYAASKELTVIVNETTKEAIDPRAFGDISKSMRYISSYYGGTMTALAVLLASACKGGARGGGDIYSESELVGSWAGSRISIQPRSALKENTDISVEIRDVLVEANEASYNLTGGKKAVRIQPEW